MAKTKKSEASYTVERVNAAVTDIRMDVTAPYKSWEQQFLITADHHWDNPKCDRSLLASHLNEARERGAGVMCFGDALCLMQGKFDKRSSKSDVRPEHMHGDYLDAVINDAADWYGQWADVLTLISPGNHETSIQKRHETDMTTRLVERINALHDGSVVRGGYGGWVRFKVNRGAEYHHRSLKYHHGAGGGGPVTRGVIQVNRQAATTDGADVIVNGHTHDSWFMEWMKERVSHAGNVQLVPTYAIRTPSYKEEYGDGTSGWHIERWGPPKPVGGWWMKITYEKRHGIHLTFERTN